MNFADVIKVMDFEVEKLFRVNWYGPVYLYKSLKPENFSQVVQRDAMCKGLNNTLTLCR